MTLFNRAINDNRLTLSSLGLYTYISNIVNTNQQSIKWSTLSTHFQYVTPHNLREALNQLVKYQYVKTNYINNMLYVSLPNSNISTNVYPNQESLFNSNSAQAHSMKPLPNSPESQCIKWLRINHTSSDFNSVYLTYTRYFHRKPPHNQQNSQYVINKIQSWLRNYSPSYINRELKYERYNTKSNIQHPLAYFTAVFSKKQHNLMSVTKSMPTKTIPTITPAHSTNPISKIGDAFSRIIQKHLN